MATCFNSIFQYLLFPDVGFMKNRNSSLGCGYCRFYTECLGMKLLRKRDIPEDRYTNAFLGYGPEDSHFVVELTYSK